MEGSKKEYLTEKIAYEYYKRSQHMAPSGQDIGDRRKLRIELQQQYGLCEIETVNILNGYHIKDYVTKYQRLEQGIQNAPTKIIKDEPEKADEVTDKNYDDWLLQRVNELSGETDD